MFVHLRSLASVALTAGSLFVGTTAAADTVKVGFLSTLSGPSAALGVDIRDGFALGVQHSGGNLGGLKAEVIVADDQFNPEAARQTTERLLKRDKVDFMTGVVFSNIMLAVGQPIFQSKTPYISANAGPSQYAGEQCNPYFFNVAWQNDNLHEAVGKTVKDKGYKKVAMLAPNYPAGKDALTGFKRYYTGPVALELYTPLNQLDFGAELSQIRASGADGVFAFYPGGLGIAFMRQWAQAGLTGKIPVFSNIALTEPTAFQAQGKSVLGTYVSAVYFAGIDNPVNKRFVQDFKTKFGRDPASYAGLAYDAMMLVDSAVKEVKGNVKDQAAFRAALKKANFQSVRGSFAFSSNNHPIQNTYLTVVDERSDGSLFLKATAIISEKAADNFVGKCPLK